ncbi:hypothetical protein AVEN_113881-1, partial [Araneus ventricosus]
VMLGELPDDFLRVTPLTSEQQLSLDEQAAIALQHQFTVASSVSGRLTIKIVEALEHNKSVPQSYLMYNFADFDVPSYRHEKKARHADGSHYGNGIFHCILGVKERALFHLE